MCLCDNPLQYNKTHQGITVVIQIMPNIKPITIRFFFIGIIVLCNIKIIKILSLRKTDLA